ncbi:protein MALE DISCOVERER 2-like [Aristolochia californica]|uniref:protein MALE DISCOVERER 2-like n=1 Tax=Aristolochia californica TaxID=171875 RepID=UPI0035DB7755
MGNRWNSFWFQLQGVFCFVLVLHSFIDECWSLNYEGIALLEFRAKVTTDPYGALANWYPHDVSPCTWTGVLCVNGHVDTLDLKDLSLVGVLAPAIGRLSHLTALVLHKNYFSGEIPKEIASLTMLQLLDLRNNNLNGTVPAEIGDMPSLKRLLLCENRFKGNIPSEFLKLKNLSGLLYDCNFESDVAVNRKVGHRSGKSHGYGEKCVDTETGSSEPCIVPNDQNHMHISRRKLLGASSSNLAALPAPGLLVEPIFATLSMGSGSFPAIASPNGSKKEPQVPGGTSQNVQPTLTMPPSYPTPGNMNTYDVKPGDKHGGEWKHIYMLPVGAFILLIATIIFFMCRSKGVTAIGPWKTGLSGQLQKAFVTGVPKLNRAELETACEDFSNIIATVPECKLYKGTLSSGVEIAVASTSVQSNKDWSKRAEQHFRKKIDIFSRVNHKNFINLLGYCEEDQPFLRLMVFEYAPSGTLYEHLHVKEVEHLDWAARMRIIMGMAYCLQYMHHDLNPPVVHSNLQSDCVFLTDDNAAKITEVSFWKDLVERGKITSEDDNSLSELPPADTESNVYNFGLLLLEIISGKLQYSEEQGSLVNWAIENLKDKRNTSYMIDPTLKAFKKNELDVICEVIQECIHHDPRHRPTMREMTLKLREVLGISAEAATPRLSPLWWAELEILSVEAS